MLIRYTAGKNGKRIPIAKIYTKEEHGIDKQLIDRDAVKIVAKLASQGFDAYIVGGAVRDLLIGRKPKDFDIVTNALPREIKKIFWNSRLIGRRFRLVHLYYPHKIIEVSTFRSGDEGNNSYGSIEEDVKRRDFSINALYYDPQNEYVIDFIEAFRDIKKGRITSLIPLDTTFVEDPVRMIRAVKYSATTGFKLPGKLRRSIKKYSGELGRCSTSRMTEEVLKILMSGVSSSIFETLYDLKLLKYMLPRIDDLVGSSKVTWKKFIKGLEVNDADVREKGENRKGRLIAGMVRELIIFPNDYENTTTLFTDIYKEIKDIIRPLTPPNQEVEMAVVKLFRNEGISPPKNAVRKRRPRFEKKTGQKSKHHEMSRYYKK